MKWTSAAPAESVWRAVINDCGVETVAQSNGTSYAVALTAGIAAVWRSYREKDLSARNNPADIPELFRYVLKKTAQEKHDLPCGEFGAGTVNAKAILKEPLPKKIASTKRKLLRGTKNYLIKDYKHDPQNIACLKKSETRELLCAEILADLTSAEYTPVHSRRVGNIKRTLSPKLRAALHKT